MCFSSFSMYFSYPSILSKSCLQKIAPIFSYQFVTTSNLILDPEKVFISLSFLNLLEVKNEITNGVTNWLPNTDVIFT